VTESVAAVAVLLLAAAGCGSVGDPGPRSSEGTRDLGRWTVEYVGPDLVVVVGTLAAQRGLGDDWLVLAARISSSGEAVTVGRAAISARAPDGRRLALIDQDRYEQGYGRHRMQVERAIGQLPEPPWPDPDQLPCRRWFLTDPFESFAHDEVFVSAFRTCSGPLVFEVPGGVQPGRWRLRIELEESEADIPFVLTAD
jgi:hypothetical protein